MTTEKGVIKMRLKATKTSMYALVSAYEDLPPMRKAAFTKAYRYPDYWLRWRDANGMACKAFLAACAGRPVLAITKERECGESAYRTYTLSINDLRNRGMIEERTA